MSNKCQLNLILGAKIPLKIVYVSILYMLYIFLAKLDFKVSLQQFLYFCKFYFSKGITNPKFEQFSPIKVVNL